MSGSAAVTAVIASEGAHGSGQPQRSTSRRSPCRRRRHWGRARQGLRGWAAPSLSSSSSSRVRGASGSGGGVAPVTDAAAAVGDAHGTTWVGDPATVTAVVAGEGTYGSGEPRRCASPSFIVVVAGGARGRDRVGGWPCCRHSRGLRRGHMACGGGGPPCGLVAVQLSSLSSSSGRARSGRSQRSRHPLRRSRGHARQVAALVGDPVDVTAVVTVERMRHEPPKRGERKDEMECTNCA